MKKEICSYGRAIAVIQRHIAAYVNAELKEDGLTYGYALFLSNISREAGCTQTDLCDQLMIDKTTTAKNIKKLESMGLIRRERDKRDQRFYHIYLTDEGEIAMKRVRTVLKQTSEILKGQMTEEQKSQAESLLRMMVTNICAEVCGHEHKTNHECE